jgi:hypothetical protein
MTHDELLAIVNVNALVNPKPLRAVVKLHKPIKDEWFNVGEIICEECTHEEYTQLYPCPTIQAIEEELQ